MGFGGREPTCLLSRPAAALSVLQKCHRREVGGNQIWIFGAKTYLVLNFWRQNLLGLNFGAKTYLVWILAPKLTWFEFGEKLIIWLVALFWIVFCDSFCFSKVSMLWYISKKTFWKRGTKFIWRRLRTGKRILKKFFLPIRCQFLTEIISKKKTNIIRKWKRIIN